MTFETICMMFTMQEPYYGILLSSMNRMEDKRISTIGVMRKGNVFELHYNPDFVNQFSTDTVCQLLKHECLHLAFNHFTLFDTPPASATENRLRNIAADLEVNCYIDRNKVDKKAGGCWCEDLGYEKELGTLEYYRKLVADDEAKQQQQKEEQKQNPQNSNNNDPSAQGIGTTNRKQDEDNGTSNQQNEPVSGSGTGNKQKQQQPNPGGSSQSSDQGDDEDEDEKLSIFAESLSSFDSHDDWPDENTAGIEQIEQQINDLLDMAATECIKARGFIPKEMEKRIEKIRKAPKPVADWRRYVRRYLGHEFTDLLRKSHKRPSKRFPDAMGNRHQRKSNVLVGIDTSGSICLREYNEFFGQIKTLYQKASFHVIECDSAIQHQYDFRGVVPQTVHGGGGTDFQPVVDYFLAHRKEYDALIYFTDGYCSIPSNTPKDTLWVVSSQGERSNRNKYRVNGASVVFIPSKN